MISDNTGYLKLPLPHPDNLLEGDVHRLREAFEMLDGNAAAVNSALQTKASGAAMTQALASKADIQALQTVAGRVDQVAASVPRLNNTVTSGSTTEAATANAAKVAYDRGTAGINAANAAQGTANTANTAAGAAQNTANAAKGVTDLVTTVPAAWRVPQAGADGKLAAAWIGGGGTIPVGHISMLPFRHNKLPPGWYFCNGTRHANGSGQANVLNALSAELKADWSISNNGSTTNVPNWFYGGRGPVMRGVDGSSRQVGSVEDGAIQNITGKLPNVIVEGPATGAFSITYLGGTTTGQGGNWHKGHDVYYNAANQVPTAAEVRMLNRGMTPAIFLGV